MTAQGGAHAHPKFWEQISPLGASMKPNLILIINANVLLRSLSIKETRWTAMIITAANSVFRLGNF